MILKKPYAFIIKHFRIIHLLLLVPMFYIAYKTRIIVSFFASYISNGYRLNGDVMISNLSASYVNIFMYIAIIIILLVFVVLAFILQNKEKPTRFYKVSILYYIGLFVLLTLLITVYQAIELDILSSTMARIVRDLAFVVHYSQYAFIGFTLIRGVGFNIKKFDFKGDIEDLQITSEDSEEFEFLVGRDSYKTKRNIRRFFRELKYYYKENKFIFGIIIVIIIGVLGTFIFTKEEVYNKEYNINDNIAFGYLNFKINKAYITDISLNGEIIKESKKYLVLQLTLENRYRDDYGLNYANLQLVINNLRISPNLSLGNYFSDFGNPYTGTLVKGVSEEKYILVYEMDKDLVTNNYQIEAYSGYDVTGGIGVISRKINIKPEIINGNSNVNSVNAGTTINLSNTHVGNTELTILGYETMNRFVYKQNGFLRELNIDMVKDFNKTFMVLDYKLDLDPESDYMTSNKSFKAFFEDFMKIKYTIGDKEYYSDVSVLNPISYKDRLVFKINKDINNADDIEAIITVRNVTYSIKIK